MGHFHICVHMCFVVHRPMQQSVKPSARHVCSGLLNFLSEVRFSGGIVVSVCKFLGCQPVIQQQSGFGTMVCNAQT